MLRRIDCGNQYTVCQSIGSKRLEMASKLRCWHCGTRLQGVALPVSRLAECPECRVDLHVCRQCRSYDTKVLGQCRHDRAERVENKTRANFCTYFTPGRRAYDPAPRDESDAARDELNVLFGVEASSSIADDELSAAERARDELDALFPTSKKKQTGGH